MLMRLDAFVIERHPSKHTGRLASMDADRSDQLGVVRRNISGAYTSVRANLVSALDRSVLVSYS